MIWSGANGFEPFAWVPWGVYIGLPPRGTMVKPAGCGSQSSVPQAAVFSADLPGMRPTALVRRGWVLPAADYCSRASNDAGSVMGSWQQLRHLAGDHCGHYLSCLINGAWGPWERPANFWWPTPIWADWWCFLRLSYARRLVGPIIPGSYQQAVVGTGLRPLGLTSGPAWQ